MNYCMEIEKLNLWYGDNHALKDVSMNIPENQVVAFIGPSGCGKSTFLRCLNRMNDYIEDCRIEGKIIYDKQDILNNKCDVVDLRTNVGMVFQKPNPFPMSIYDNIAYGPKCQGLKDKQKLNESVVNSLKQVGLYDEVKDRLHSSALGLSGGQQQRLCIARAIAMNPKVILMDEPTSALDPISTNTIEELILQLRNQYTIVIVTHNMQQAARISDQTAFFLMGEVIEMGETEQIFSHPKDPRCENYITGRFG